MAIFNLAGMATESKTVIVIAPTGSTVTMSKDGETKSISELPYGGMWAYPAEEGTWTVKVTSGSNTQTKTVTVGDDTSYVVEFKFQLFASDFDWAAFGALGTDYEILNDNGAAIPQSQWATAENWNARILKGTGKVLTPKRSGSIDVFAIGGGSTHLQTGNNPSYGKCGAVNRATNVTIEATGYPVTIGAGAVAAERTGGATTGFGVTAQGGAVPTTYNTDPGATTTYRGITYGGRNTDNVWTADGKANSGQAGTSNAVTLGKGGSGCLVISNHRG